MKQLKSDKKIGDMKCNNKEPTLEEIEEMEYRRDNPQQIRRIPEFKLDYIPNPDNISKKKT